MEASSIVKVSLVFDVMIDLSKLEAPALDEIMRKDQSLIADGWGFRLIPSLTLRQLAEIDERFESRLAPRLYGGGAATSLSPDGKIAGVCGFLPAPRMGERYRAYHLDSSIALIGPLVSTELGEITRPSLLLGVLEHCKTLGFARAYVQRLSEADLAELRRLTDQAVVQIHSCMPERKPRIVLLCGEVSAVTGILEGNTRGRYDVELVRVLSQEDPPGKIFATASALGLDTHSVIRDRATQTREAYFANIIELVAEAKPDLVLFATWMQIAPPSFVSRFPELLNVHPSYLPFEPTAQESVFPDGTVQQALRGPDCIGDAIRLGITRTGMSVHRVTNEVDRGELLARVVMSIPHVRDLEPYGYKLQQSHLDQMFHAFREALQIGIANWIEESWPPQTIAGHYG